MEKMKMKMGRNDEKKYFLETSIQFSRLFGTSRQQKVVNDIINDSICYSSSFILREFHSLVTHALIEYYFFIDLYSSVREGTREFLNSYSFRSRKIKILTQVISEELASFSNPKKAMFRLELYILEIEKRFLDVVDHKIDQVKCPILQRAVISPGESGLSKFYGDFECANVCCIEIFLRSRKDKIKKLLEVDLNKIKSDEFSALVEIYKKILIDSETTKTERLKLTDTVIGLECPSTNYLLSFDKIFKILCPPLNIRAYFKTFPPMLS